MGSRSNLDNDLPYQLVVRLSQKHYRWLNERAALYNVTKSDELRAILQYTMDNDTIGKKKLRNE